jgi:succinate dehydrogenase/fumarate reductase flavoprotein subunit
LRLEGTVRGTGGIRVVNESCGSSVPGLYAAGDAATRELICGGFTGGGSHNAAWAMSSGYWAGQGAALHAKQLGEHASARTAAPAGRATLRPDRDAHTLDPEALVRAVQDEVFPFDRNLFRSARGLSESLTRLDDLWEEAQARPAQNARDVLRGREAAAMTATARLMYHSAQARTETRGMHKHVDHPALDPTQQHRLISHGLDTIRVSREPLQGAASAQPVAAAT